MSTGRGPWLLLPTHTTQLSGFPSSVPAFLPDSCWAGRGHLVAPLQNCTLLSEGLPVGQEMTAASKHAALFVTPALPPQQPEATPSISSLLETPLLCRDAGLHALLLGKAKQLLVRGTRKISLCHCTIKGLLCVVYRKPSNGHKMKAMGGVGQLPKEGPRHLPGSQNCPKWRGNYFGLYFIGQGHQLGTFKDHWSAWFCVTNKSAKANTNGDLHRHPGLNTFLLVSPITLQMLPGVSGGRVNYNLHSKTETQV